MTRGYDRPMRRVLLAVLALVAIEWLTPATPDSAAPAFAGPAESQALTIYFIDVEGGQSTLIVTPSRHALLVDAGFPGFNDRDPKRILAAIHDAGVTRLDYLLLTHFHQDHIGGVAALADQIPIDTFIDHDTVVDTDRFTVAAFSAYEPVRQGRHLIHPKAGDRLPLADVDVVVTSANGGTLTAPLPGGGALTPSCATFERQADDPGENAQSIGIWLQFGKLRFLDLGDLNWNMLARLVCPANMLGPIDVYLVSHHGNLDSDLPQMIDAVRPRVAVIDNGANKGGAPETFATLRQLLGLDAVWQLHRSARPGAENFDDDYVANLDGPDDGHWVKLTANLDGDIAVVNSRNGYTRTYRAVP